MPRLISDLAILIAAEMAICFWPVAISFARIQGYVRNIKAVKSA
jgi:hypothetical protein